MAVFSTNQNRQLYVVKAVQSTKVSALGDIKVSSDKEGNIFFNYKGVGNKMRTDIIDPKTITDITLTTSFKHVSPYVCPNLSFISLNLSILMLMEVV